MTIIETSFYNNFPSDFAAYVILGIFILVFTAVAFISIICSTQIEVETRDRADALNKRMLELTHKEREYDSFTKSFFYKLYVEVRKIRNIFRRG